MRVEAVLREANADLDYSGHRSKNKDYENTAQKTKIMIL